MNKTRLILISIPILASFLLLSGLVTPWNLLMISMKLFFLCLFAVFYRSGTFHLTRQ